MGSPKVDNLRSTNSIMSGRKPPLYYKLTLLMVMPGYHIIIQNKFYSVCVCVFFPSILDIKFVGRTSRGHTGGTVQYKIKQIVIIDNKNAIDPYNNGA